MKRIFLTVSVLLSIFISGLPVSVSAEDSVTEVTEPEQIVETNEEGDDLYPYIGEGFCGSTVKYTIDNDGELRIFGTGDMYNYTYEDVGSSSFPSNVPDWYDLRSDIKRIVIEQGVTSIGNAAFINLENVESIEIPEGITNIGEGAFYRCLSLKEIILPQSLQSIRTHAFHYCNALTDIKIPANVNEIDLNAFSWCYSLSTLTVAADNATYSSLDNILFNKSQTELIFCPKARSGSYTVPASVKRIGERAFDECTKLTEISLPTGLISIGDYAFCSCESATKIDIPETVNYIGDYAFYYCRKMTEAHIPAGITSIANHAFHSCMGLTDVTLPENLKTIGDHAFDHCQMLQEIEIPEGVTEIGTNAFFNCQFSKIVIPAGVTKISDRCFGSCILLSDISLPEGLLEIGAGAFANCNQMVSFNIPDHVKVIGENAFTNCDGMIEFGFPADLESIGPSAFSNCISLTEVVLPSGVKTIGTEAFKGCTALNDIVLSDSLISIGGAAFGACLALEQINIPEGVTEIGNGGFSGCRNLKKVVLPSTLTSLGANAFSLCGSLPSINLPDSLTEIKDYTFHDCSVLASIKMPRNLTRIGMYAFNRCFALTSITIPEGTETLANDSFFECSSLKTVVLPVSAVEIGPRAFGGCNSITDVYYTGSEAEYRNKLLTNERWDEEWNEDFFHQVDWHFDYVIPAQSEPSKITLSADYLELNPGKSAKLLADVNPYDAEQRVIWSSNHPEIASVNSNGKVTALANGSAVITAVSARNPNIKASCTVNIAECIEVNSASLALNEKIQVRFYVYIPEPELETTDIKVLFNDKETILHAKDADKAVKGGRECRVVTVDLFVKQLRDDIQLTVQDLDGNPKYLEYRGTDVTDGYHYCAEDYVTSVEENADDALLIDLVHKMNWFGLSAQEQFNYNSVYFSYPDEITNLDDTAADAYKVRNTGAAEGIEYASGSLQLDSDTGIRVYFTVDDGYSIDDYTFVVNDKKVKPVLKSGNKYYVTIKGIAAKELNKWHTITITDKAGNTLTTEYCGLSYVCAVLNSGSAPYTLYYLCKSIYLYWDAAYQYFNRPVSE